MEGENLPQPAPQGLAVNLLRMALISACVVRLSLHSLDDQWAALTHTWPYLVWLVLCTVFSYHFTDQTPVTRYAAWAAVLGAAAVFWKLERAYQYTAVLSGAIWVAYILLLRERTWLKPFLVALAWTVATHVAFNHSLLMGMHRFGWILALTLCYDLADAAYDRAAATPTIPLIYGVKATFLLGVVALLTTAVTSLFLYQSAYLAIQCVALLLAAGLLWLLAFSNPSKAPSGIYRYKLAADALLLV